MPQRSDSEFSIHRSTLEANRLGLLRYLEKRGKLHLAGAIAAEGQSLDAVPSERLPLRLVHEVYQRISTLIQEPFLGVETVQSLPLEQLPMVNTLRQALTQAGLAQPPFSLTARLLSRYFQVITEVVTVSVRDVSSGTLIRVQPCDPSLVSHHQVEGSLTGIIRLLQAFNDVRPAAVYLVHERDQQACGYLGKVWQAPVCSLQPHSEAFYAGAVPAEKRSLHRILAPLQSLFDAEFPGRSTAHRCRHLLATTLGLGEPTREAIAAALNMSVSTLQRRLREEGVQFGQLLEAVRREHAETLLRHRQLPAADAAFLLGYQSTSQFFKAFKSWFGQTPAEYRAGAD